LRADFSEWRMETEAWVDAPGSAIIRKARAWSPDLIVVGSHGRSGLSRLVIGSVSEHVLHHVNCSVRISRHRLHSQDRAISLIVGVDGSSDSRAAVQWIALRDWPAGTEIRAVAVEDIRLSAAAAAEGVYPSNVVEHESQSKESAAAHEAQEILSKAGLIATYQVLTGIPGEVLTAEAEKVAADGIFVGARGLSKVERILLGSVSTSVASRAHCSVEVVRDHLKN
jgi:nucleotide-binding universal stress UspA family protein